MKLSFVVPGILFCLAAQATGQSTQQSLTGCVDEQDGLYVLLDDQMLKIVNLVSAGSDKEVFAKHLGHKVQVKGTQSSENKGTVKVTSIEQVSGNCAPAK